jgi:thiol:disulfide interchange protein
MRAALLLAVMLLAGSARAQNQVEWALTLEPAKAAPGGKVLARLHGKIASGWHLYSLSTPKGGPIPTTIRSVDAASVESQRIFEPKPKRAFDPNFNLDTETYEGDVVFLLDIALKKDAPAGPVEIGAEVRYQVCSDKLCIPPVKRRASSTMTIDAAAPAVALAIPAGYSEAKPAAAAAVQTGAATPADSDLGIFLLTAFGLGFLAIFTPCVFPMIPITMSFFLNRPETTRRAAVTQAAIFCLGIIVLFSGLGLVTTAILGPFGVVQLGSNPWVNGLIAVIFTVFGLSLLGAFEITIPSVILTRLDRVSQQGGTFGTLLMGLTFSLASFACVGPFVGTLLAASVQGGSTRPLAGMAVFATGLASPFFLLAIFPAYLKRMPKSGGWLARVKVVMGFIILAIMLKYLSSVDQVLQWNVLTRERFLAAWLVLFAMAGFYLLGFIRLEGVSKDETLGLGRLLTGAFLVIFAISLVPGMFGARLGELDAYVPLPTGQSGFGAAGGAGGEGAIVWMKNQFQEGLDKAKREGKLVFVNFTGYACTNCHWMKSNMFPRPEIAAAMKQFVLVELYTDGSDPASEQNQELEQKLFHTIAIPFYGIFDGDGKVLASFPGQTRNAQEFLAFLSQPAPAPVAAASAPAAPTRQSVLSDLGLKTLEGAAFDASPVADRVLVLNFWATYCVPCISEIPNFNRFSAEWASKGVEVVGVALDEEGAEVVKPFLRKHPIKYRVALGSEAVSEKFQATPLPTTIVFDRHGKTIQRLQGFARPEAVEAAVRQAL